MIPRLRGEGVGWDGLLWDIGWAGMGLDGAGGVGSGKGQAHAMMCDRAVGVGSGEEQAHAMMCDGKGEVLGDVAEEVGRAYLESS